MLVENAGIICSRVSGCEICETDGRLLYSGLTDVMFNAKGRWNLVQCKNVSCGLIWSDPQPHPDQISKLYENYYTHRGSSAEAGSYKSKGLSRIVKRVLATVLFWKAPVFLSDNLHLQNMKPGALLEVGCGDGAFLARAAMDGWSAYGIDFDAKAVTAANKLIGVSAQVGELLDCKFTSQSFDAIIMNNVIEHVWNPIETIRECFRLLRPVGRLVLITPNTESTGHAIFKQDWRGLEPPRHLFIYNRTSLIKLAERANFSKTLSFSSAGGYSGVQMLQSSKETAAKNGRSARLPAVNFDKIIRREAIRSIFGGTSGEWCVMICEK